MLNSNTVNSDSNSLLLSNNVLYTNGAPIALISSLNVNNLNKSSSRASRATRTQRIADRRRANESFVQSQFVTILLDRARFSAISMLTTLTETYQFSSIWGWTERFLENICMQGHWNLVCWCQVKKHSHWFQTSSSYYRS